MPASFGNWLIGLGIVLLIVGLVAKTGALSWLGHLPGDIHVKRDNAQFFLPVTSMIVVSVVLSVLINLVRRWF